MSGPLVSILITSYNREKYIRQSIESALASDYENFELIITDNCSTDSSYAIAKEYETKDKRVRVFKTTENIGQFGNRNYAASLANGEYLKYLDSDDILYVYGLSVLMKSALQFPEAGFIASSVLMHEDLPYPIFLKPAEAISLYFFDGGFPSTGPSCTLLKKTAFNAVKGFDIPSYAGTDNDLLLKIASRYPIVKAEPGVAWYRRHEGQELLVALHNYEYEIKSYKPLISILNDSACPLDEKKKNIALKKIKRDAARQILKFASRFQFGYARKLYADMKPSAGELIRALKK